MPVYSPSNLYIWPAGQSHLINPIQNAQKILVVPPGFEPLGMDANTGRVFLAQQIQANMAEHREIFIGMTEPDARFILPKDSQTYGIICFRCSEGRVSGKEGSPIGFKHVATFTHSDG
jgi:hypothetical protein